MPDNIICIIPARGGSKRLPKKNMMPLAGKPLIAHSIEHAKQSRHINRIIVSTDDPEIARISQQHGAEVIWRPAELATDQATSESALKHVLETLEQQGYQADLIVFLQCTSPIRDPKDIDLAIKTLDQQKADSLFSACRNDRFVWRKEKTSWGSLNYDYQNRHRDQEHPEEVRENGSIYVFKPSLLKESNNRLGGRIAVYEMDYWSSFQIDNPEHFELCEWILQRKKGADDLNRLPLNPRLLVTDFDGVMTDNKVTVREDRKESVICHRGDGWGISLLKAKGVQVVVLSTEANKVVQARCTKLGIPCFSNSKNKLETLKSIAREFDVPMGEMIYLGNDTNDLPCLQSVGCGVGVADSHAEVKRAATLILKSNGGEGALRELCDLILKKIDGTKT